MYQIRTQEEGLEVFLIIDNIPTGIGNSSRDAIRTLHC